MKNALLPLLLATTLASASAESGPALDPGDHIDLVFSIKQDPLDGVYTVSKDGTISLPFIGKLHVAGKDPAETCRIIRQKYLQDGIYTRLSVALSRPAQDSISIPTPDGRSHIRKPLPAGQKTEEPTGDFHTPQEKMKLLPHPQLDVKNRDAPP